MTSFLTNRDNINNHLKVLKDNLLLYRKAYFAAAFFKYSGLELLKLPIQEFLGKGGQIHIIVGQNFGLTEPKALHKLMAILKPYPESKLYLAKANFAKKIFHPKLYLFNTEDDCCIISGSANITLGGLVSNKEVSLVAECKVEDKLWLDGIGYFNNLMQPDNSDEASLLIIKQYETFFEQQRLHNKSAKSIPYKTKSQLGFNYENLLKYYRKFNNKERKHDLKMKLLSYNNAKQVLDKIADDAELTQMKFEPLLDVLVGSKEEDNLWHSGSLYRLRRSVYPYYREFRELVRYIRQNKDERPSIVFENAKAQVNLIKGAAANYIAEIMMTYNPAEFANMNKNPLTVLKEEAGVNIKSHSSSFTGADYEQYCELVKEISSQLGLNGMIEADSFFNTIYWDLKKRIK